MQKVPGHTWRSAIQLENDGKSEKEGRRKSKNKKYPQVCVTSAGTAEGLIGRQAYGPSAAKYTRVGNGLATVSRSVLNVNIHNHKIKLHFFFFGRFQMLLKKRFLFFAALVLLICVGQAAAGPNANAVLSLDLIANGGAGNQKDDGVTSGTVSGQGTKIAIEVFAKGVTTPLEAIWVTFNFDPDILTFVKAGNSAFWDDVLPAGPDAILSAAAPVTLPSSGFLVRAEFTTAVDVTGREFSIGIAGIGLYENGVLIDAITTTNVITFNANVTPSPDFDGDGMVGIPDFLMFVNVFGSSQGDGKYEAKYDLDGNGEIGIPDFLTFVDNFGKEVPSSGGGGGDRGRAALVALYNATDGANWNDNTNWLSDKPLGEWYGVTTNAQGRVGRLDLHKNQLKGAIPDSLGNLSNLTLLNLRNNQLTGAIPESIGKLTNLSKLFLSFNQLTGPIPESFSNLTNLFSLALDNNQLSGPIPEWIGNLSNLETLQLDENQLTGPIPESIEKLSNLEWLILSRNQLTGPIPGWIGNLSNLEHLTLGENQLTGPIPESFSNLTNLLVLDLVGSQLTGPIPGWIGNLTKLELLILHKNQLTGPIPEWIGNLSNLLGLTLHENQLSGPVPASIGNLTKLSALGLHDNPNLCMPASLKDWQFYSQVPPCP